MADLDSAAIKAAHERHVPGCQTRAFRSQQHKRCEPYRLADALEAEQARTARLWATWEPYDTDDEGNVPWRLQRDMRAAYTEQTPHATTDGYCVCYDQPAPDCGIAEHRAQAKPPHATTARVRSEPQSRPRVTGVAAWEVRDAEFRAWLDSRPVDDGTV